MTHLKAYATLLYKAAKYGVDDHLSVGVSSVPLWLLLTPSLLAATLLIAVLAVIV